MNKLSRSDIKEIRAEIDSALSNIAKRRGLDEIKVGRISFNDQSFAAKVVGRVMGGLTKEGQRYTQFSKVYNLPPMPSTFAYKNELFQITGLNRPKTKVLATSLRDNKQWAFHTAFVRSQFGLPDPATPATPATLKSRSEFSAIEL